MEPPSVRPGRNLNQKLTFTYSLKVLVMYYLMISQKVKFPLPWPEGMNPAPYGTG
jgi:hypothetical protein